MKMTPSQILLAPAALVLSLSVSACLFDDDKTSTPAPKGEDSTVVWQDTLVTSGGQTWVLSSPDTLRQGYWRLKLCAKDDKGAPLVGLKPALNSWMVMSTKSHSSPVDSAQATDSQGCTQAGVVWTMPSVDSNGSAISGMMGGTWSLGLKVGSDSARADMLPVRPAALSPLAMFADPGDTAKRLIIAMVQPRTPKVGVQDLQFAVYRRQSMSVFEAAPDVELSFEPEMPSMSHGSPGNVQAVPQDSLPAGHRLGKVNFTMTGDWRLHLRTTSQGKVDSTHYIDLLF